MCMGMGQQMLIPPTDKARLIADYMRACFVLLLILSVIAFVIVDVLNGIINLLCVFIGYMAIRNPEGYNYQQVVCFLMLQAILFFFALIKLFLTLGGITSIGSPPTATWAFYVFGGGLLGAPVVYALSLYFTYSLYKQMKVVLDEMMNGLQGGGGDGGGGGPLMGNGYDVQAPSRESRERDSQRDRQAGAGMWRHEERHPAPAAAAPAPSAPPAAVAGGGGGGSFTAFSGQGHKLGD